VKADTHWADGLPASRSLQHWGGCNFEKQKQKKYDRGPVRNASNGLCIHRAVNWRLRRPRNGKRNDSKGMSGGPIFRGRMEISGNGIPQAAILHKKNRASAALQQLPPLARFLPTVCTVSAEKAGPHPIRHGVFSHAKRTGFETEDASIISLRDFLAQLILTNDSRFRNLYSKIVHRSVQMSNEITFCFVLFLPFEMFSSDLFLFFFFKRSFGLRGQWGDERRLLPFVCALAFVH